MNSMRRLLPIAAVALTLGWMVVWTSADDGGASDPDLAKDLEMLQGSWELRHGTDAAGRSTTRSIKTIEGSVETLRRFNARTGDKTHEHSVEFQLSKSGAVRVFTFYPVGGSPENGASFVYKLGKDDFWDIPGLLQGEEYRNYQQDPTVWHWKRIDEGGGAAGEGAKGNRLTE